MKKFALFVIVVFVIALLAVFYEKRYGTTGPISNRNQTRTSPTQNSSSVQVIASNLEIPWSIVFLPDGRIMFAERSGTVKIINPDGNTESVAQINVYHANDTEGGLLGMTLDPKFKDTHLVYLYYTYSASGGKDLNKVVKMKFENDKLSDEKVLVDKIPGALYHNGGRIKFGPDGYLYITTGDSESPSLAQDKNSLAGKILRVTDSGTAAPGNPFKTQVYSYGHRNPQGLAWDNHGNLFETEHGRSNPTGFDEVNQIKAGGNYGWPTIQGDETKSGMVTPLANSGESDTWAPSGAAYYKGSIFFGGLKGEALYEYKIESGQVVKHLQGQFGRLRDVVLGPDNMLYVTTSNRDGRGNPRANDDQILKVNPASL